MKRALIWLFTRPDPVEKWWQLIAWWELRRIPYNLVVGIAGVISLLLFYFFITHSSELKGGEDAVEPMALVIAPFIINFIYTAGWIVELLVYGIARRDVKAGPVLFAVGTAFSLCVVALPSGIWGVIWLFRMVRGTHG